MTKKLFFISLALVTAAISLTACSGSKAKKALGLSRQSPDEFAVVERAPLSMPPSYQLNAPEPGAPRPQEKSTTEQARAIITGSETATTGTTMTSGETAFIQQIGAEQADPNIRETLKKEYGVVPEGSTTERTINKLNPFKEPAGKGKLIDPTKEADQLIKDGIKAPKPVIQQPEDKSDAKK